MPAIRAYDKWPRPVGGDENELTITDLVLAVVMAPAPLLTLYGAQIWELLYLH